MSTIEWWRAEGRWVRRRFRRRDCSSTEYTSLKSDAGLKARSVHAESITASRDSGVLEAGMRIDLIPAGMVSM